MNLNTCCQHIYSHWHIRIICLFLTLLVFSMYFLYHLNATKQFPSFNIDDPSSSTHNKFWTISSSSSTSNYHLICTAPSYKNWIKPYILLLLGACVGQALTLYGRFLGNKGGLRHPNASKLLICIATIQAICIICFYFDMMPTTCQDYLGVRLPYFLWFEWLCTVPYTFFLVSMMDVKRNTIQPTDIYIELLGSLSLLLLFTGNISLLPDNFHWCTIIAANLMMPIALFWQQYDAYLACQSAQLTVDRITQTRKLQQFSFAGMKPASTHCPESLAPLADTSTSAHRDAVDALCVAHCKWTTSTFMTITFTAIQVIYYLNVFDIIDDEMYLLITYAMSYVAKVMFAYLLTDAHIEILDPNKFLIIEERRKAEESRLNFLRYVFHEVRVPLNSVVLGLQLLHDNDIAHTEKETLTMMKDATKFMSETLNDVLSLQKIEQGKMELEIKPFSPKRLLSTVVSSFRATCESKHIKIVVNYDKTIPSYLLGDRFRLEHVLGNLLCNSVKFSDEYSTIQLSAERVVPDTATSFDASKVTVIFKVKDNACGMSPEDQSMLFQPFMQIRPGELQKGRGSGLGLSICKSIIDLHGGVIGCHSKKRIGNDILSGGSEFYITIAFDCTLRTSSDEDDSSSCSSSSDFHCDDVVAQTHKDEDVNDDENIANHRFVEQLHRLSVDHAMSCCLQGSPRTSGKLIPVNTNHDIIQDTMCKVPDPISPCNNRSLHVPSLCATSTETLSTISTTISHRVPSTPVSCPVVASLASLSIDNKVEIVKAPKSSEIGNILVCDDVLSNRKMLAMLLKRKGLSCDQVADGSEAVSIVQEKGLDYYDIIFMDSVMPIMTGPDASTILRKNGFTNLIIGVTGNAMDMDILEYEAAGADMILTKPVRVDLLDKILSYCRLYGCNSFYYISNHIDDSTFDEDDNHHTSVEGPEKVKSVKDWVMSQ